MRSGYWRRSDLPHPPRRLLLRWLQRRSQRPNPHPFPRSRPSPNVRAPRSRSARRCGINAQAGRPSQLHRHLRPKEENSAGGTGTESVPVARNSMVPTTSSLQSSPDTNAVRTRVLTGIPYSIADLSGSVGLANVIRHPDQRLVGAENVIRVHEQRVFSTSCGNNNVGNPDQQRGKWSPRRCRTPWPPGFCR